MGQEKPKKLQVLFVQKYHYIEDLKHRILKKQNHGEVLS